MRTYLDCIPCFLRQALKAARVAGVDVDVQKEVLVEVSRLVSSFSLENTPPEIGRIVYHVVSELTGNSDPYEEIKKNSNKKLLSLYPDLKNMVKNSDDKLLAALKLAVAGNVIDYGVPKAYKIEEEIENCLTSDFAIFDYQDFKNRMDTNGPILYLADNAGETVFDRILIEELGKDIFYAVKERPIINDELQGDAHDCGIDKIARVISSGSDAPGTILKLCSQEFMEIYHNASLIISKGQGNFEALSEQGAPIFFLLLIKCQVIASDVGCKVNDMVLKSNAYN